jgi:hypothetical protein
MPDQRRLYIDSCCFIDMVKIGVGKTLTEDREQDVWFLKRLLEANRDGEVQIFSSTLTIAECTHVGDNKLSDGVKSQFSRLLTSGQYLRLVQLTPFIAESARDLRWEKGINLKGADSIHAASDLEMHCEEFLTSNGRFERINAYTRQFTRLGLSIKTGRNTDCLPAKYRQLHLDDQKPS